MTEIFLKRGVRGWDLDAETSTQGEHVNTKAETEVMNLPEAGGGKNTS